MGRYVKKIAVIAVRWNGQMYVWPEGFYPPPAVFNLHMGGDGTLCARITNEHSVMELSMGDWLIRDIDGGYYVCPHHVFEASYEEERSRAHRVKAVFVRLLRWFGYGRGAR